MPFKKIIERREILNLFTEAKSKLSEGDSKIKVLMQKSMLLKKIGLAVAVAAATAISIGLYAKMAVDSKNLKNNQEDEYGSELKSRASALQELYDQIDFSLELKNLSESLLINEEKNKQKINNQSVQLQQFSSNIANVKESTNNLTDNFNDQFMKIREGYNEEEKLLEEQYRKLLNISSKFNVEKTSLNNLSDYREEYKNLNNQYLLDQDSKFQNLTEKQEEIIKDIEEKLEKQSSDLQELLEKQEEDEEFLENIESTVQNNSKSISNISNSVEDIETELSECLTAPCKNGGTCKDELKYYTCTCAMGHVGTNCEEVEDNTFRPGNGYVYKKTPTEQSYNDSRTLCKSYGGDLAYEGQWNLTIREEIKDALSLQKVFFGLFKSGTTWRFVNETETNSSLIEWRDSYPVSNHVYSGMDNSNLMTVSFEINTSIHGLCERKL